jgi:hypothetical protein
VETVIARHHGQAVAGLEVLEADGARRRRHRRNTSTSVVDSSPVPACRRLLVSV